MSIIDHIAELRAELAGSILTKRERAQLESELRDALAALVQTRQTPKELGMSALAA